MNESGALWRCIHAQFEFHRKPTDPDSQAAMDRVAQKCLQSPVRRSFNPSNCSVRAHAFSREELADLVVYHQRVGGYPSKEPIVVLLWVTSKVVIEGNTRVNNWRGGASLGPFPGILVNPNEPHAVVYAIPHKGERGAEPRRCLRS